ncbi:MAG: 4Fe-4S binding protein [Caldisericia bacterium]|nr:4Fe-4S binding protein [Caldisericia bacterium]
MKNKISTLKKSEKSNYSVVRWAILIVVLIFITLIAFFHQNPEILWKTPSGCMLCPFGGVESFLSWISTGYFIKRTALSSLILLAGVLITTILFGRVFCGQMCPLGTLQEIFGRLGRKHLKSKKRTLPGSLDKSFRWLKYIVMVVFIFFTWSTSTLFFRWIDPWVAYSHIFTTEIFSVFLAGFLVLLISLIGSFFWEKFFCKYLCPLGAFLSLLAPVSIFKIHREKTSCTSCNVCNQVCPVNIDIANSDVVTDKECISCYKCVDKCPENNALTIRSKSKLNVTPLLTIIVTYALIVGLIVATSITGQFSWSSGGGKGLNNQPNNDTHTNCEDEHETDNSIDIKDNQQRINMDMTLREISNQSNIPLETLANKFNISESNFDIKINQVEDKSGNMNDIRTFIDNY